MPHKTEFSGALAKCERCGVRLRVSETRREDSAPFRRALVPKGVCPDCVMTQFLYNTYPINWQLDERGPELLLHPAARDAFVSSGVMSRCEMNIDEVNWQRVVDNWHLPVKIAKKNPRNPYRMGESPRSQLRNQPIHPENPPRCVDAVAFALAETFGGSADDWEIDDSGGSIVARKRKPQ